MSLVCAIGSAAVDVKARLARPALDMTDVPGRITLTPGGVSRNIAENLARLGAQAVFIGVVGDDAQARILIDHSRAAGVDVRPIVRSHLSTATLAVMIEPDGHQLAGVFSGEILNTLAPADLAPHLDAIRSADALAADGGVPEATLRYLAGVTRPGALVYANPGSAALAARLVSILARCDLITCNHLEAEALTGQSDAAQATEALLARGAKRAVITLGAQGIVCADAARRIVLPAQPTCLVEATGAGDALAAAMIFSLLRGASIDAALSLGLRAAALTCEAETSVSPDLSLDTLLRR